MLIIPQKSAACEFQSPTLARDEGQSIPVGFGAALAKRRATTEAPTTLTSVGREKSTMTCYLLTITKMTESSSAKPSG
ncbi:Uncharacterised protein [Vibrio cholerae]|nr:Uncharacterised protein [Vibrio cholerae]